MADLEKIRCELKKQLKKERYIHTIGVMYTAASIAIWRGYRESDDGRASA